MDFDPREFLDPEEDFDKLYEDELENMRDVEQDIIMRTDNCSSRKSLNFTDVRNDKTISSSKPDTSSIRKSQSDASIDISLPSTSRITTPERQLVIPSTSKSSPLPFADLDYIEASSVNAFRIPVTEGSNETHSNKRTVEELFGDIDDIDFTRDDSSPTRNKRTRLDGTTANFHSKPIDKDSLTIDRILECRKRLLNQNINIDKSNDLSLSTDDSFQKPQVPDVVLSRRVPKYAFMTLRNGKDEKFYAKLHSEDAIKKKNISVTEQCKSYRLLTIPFENILLEANSIVEKKFAAQEKEKVKQTNSDPSGVQEINNESELWVEKYKPTSYLHLLSDEGTNRVLLQWLKLWDKVVFGRETQFKKKSNAFNNNNFRFSKWRPDVQLDEELDDVGCPKRRIALLCGPPGLGKTTLAHVIAKHAGYNAVEMNASDDRSPEAFKQQLEAATQMRAVFGASPKPNCLIIDEIDGAPSASIDLLIKFTKGELKSKGKKKTKQENTLRRPIICICNDIYVPALRSLRQMAFVVHFPPTSQQRLAQRLVDLARFEKIKTDIGAMLALCEKTNNDIRNCISTIHCLKEEKITSSTIRSASIGVKDMQKGLFTAWQEIFQIQARTIENNTVDVKNVPGQKKKTEAQLFKTKRMVSTLRTVQSNGDYDRLMQGVYENYLNVPSNDSSMRNITMGMEWFCYMDRLKTAIANSQIYTVMAYMPYSFVVWNFLFATYQKPRLNYPSLMYELMTRQNKHHQIVQEVLKGMEVKIRAYSHHEQLLLDTLPLITSVLNPSFRQVSIQLFSATEKEALYQLVSTMIDYNLNYVQERTQDGSYEFNLDPNVDELVNFPEIKKNKNLTYALKLMIAREIEQEKIRRLENTLTKKNLNGGLSLNTTTENNGVPLDHEMDFVESSAPPSVPTPAVESPRTQNHLQKLTPKEIKKTATCSVTKDFFGRVVENSALKNKNTTKVDEIVKSDIWFHFKEGFSNAVRRTVYIKDLIS